MRLDGFSRHNRLNHGDAHAEMMGKRSNAPVGADRFGRGATGCGGNPMADDSIIFSFSSSARLVHQASHPVCGKTSPPFNDHGLAHDQYLLDVFVPPTLGG